MSLSDWQQRKLDEQATRQAGPTTPMRVKARDLGLGDIVKVCDGMEYSTATVYKLDDNGDRHAWRPYVHTSDFSYAGQRVVPYIGIEDFILSANTEVILLRKGEKVR